MTGAVIRDPAFRAAVDCVHAGDVAGLERRLAADPGLRHAVARDGYPADYFRHPKLLWFVANNPILVEAMPPDIVATTRLLARGAAQEDLDYTLELVMTGERPRLHGVQVALMDVLLEAGARVTPESIAGALGHRELGAVRALLERGEPLTAPIAAALGRTEELAALLPNADAFAMAVINGQVEAARLALEAGADVDAFIPVHAHSTALHQAALLDDPAMARLLLAHGARTDIRDRLWDGTPRDWAVHEGRPQTMIDLLS